MLKTLKIAIKWSFLNTGLRKYTLSANEAAGLILPDLKEAHIKKRNIENGCCCWLLTT